MPPFATTLTSRNDCVGRVSQAGGLAIRENDHGLFGLARHRQASIFYRNWPRKWVLSGQRQASGRLNGYPERLEEQSQRRETLQRVAFPQANAGLGMIGLEESLLFF